MLHRPSLLILLGCLITLKALAAPQNIQSEVLSMHNSLRARHHAPGLEWDSTLAQYAAKHAAHCKFQHSGSPYGENLAAGYPSASAAIQAWYSEGEHYSYAHPGFTYGQGHFTQLVWVSSKKIGCAYQACDGHNGTPGKFLVCEYSPAGNITNAGYFKMNVLPLVPSPPRP